MPRKRQPLAPTPSVPPSPQTKWEYVKSLFLYSETILIARLDVFFGFVVAVLAAMDWTSFVGIDPSNRNQALFTGSGLVVHGLVTELARRRNATMT